MARPQKLFVTADVVAFCVTADGLHTLMIRRAKDPFKGRLALPGGFVEPDEDLPAAARREFTEETGLATRGSHLEELGTYGKPKRDPRGRTISTVFTAFMSERRDPTAGSDAATAQWLPTRELLGSPRKLAFDHHRILGDALEHLSTRIEHTALATALLPKEFTVSQLRHVFEAVWDIELDPRNFHRKVLATEDLVVDTGRRVHHGGRPARLYRAGGATHNHPAFLRTSA